MYIKYTVRMTSNISYKIKHFIGDNSHSLTLCHGTMCIKRYDNRYTHNVYVCDTVNEHGSRGQPVQRTTYRVDYVARIVLDGPDESNLNVYSPFVIYIFQNFRFKRLHPLTIEKIHIMFAIKNVPILSRIRKIFRFLNLI